MDGHDHFTDRDRATMRLDGDYVVLTGQCTDCPATFEVAWDIIDLLDTSPPQRWSDGDVT